MREVWDDFERHRWVEIWDNENKEVYTLIVEHYADEGFAPAYCIGDITVREDGLEIETDARDCELEELPWYIRERFTELWPLMLVAM